MQDADFVRIGRRSGQILAPTAHPSVWKVIFWDFVVEEIHQDFLEVTTLDALQHGQ